MSAYIEEVALELAVDQRDALICVRILQNGGQNSQIQRVQNDWILTIIICGSSLSKKWEFLVIFLFVNKCPFTRAISHPVDHFDEDIASNGFHDKCMIIRDLVRRIRVELKM